MNYDKTSPESILRFAKKLKNKALVEVNPHFAFTNDQTGIHSKSEVGDFYEAYFDIKKNSSPEPDFEDAGVELKIIPLKRIRRGLSIKERTKICNINYVKLLDEDWNHSSAKKKLNKILFIFFEHVHGEQKKNFKTKEILLYEPTKSDFLFFKTDWSRIWSIVAHGEAHNLTEKVSQYLSACTSGTGRMIKQPESILLAKERSFSLKSCFTRQLWEERIKKKSFESIMENLSIQTPKQFERTVLLTLRKYEGETIGGIAKKFGIQLSKAKHWKQIVVKKILGTKNHSSKLAEFEKQGVSVKIIPVNEKTGAPFEAMSFPNFDHMTLEDETWDESEFHNATEKLLIIPLYSQNKNEKENFRMGNAFFWLPSVDQESIMKREWAYYVKLIKGGKADSLPTAKETKILHVRPHARDGSDKEDAPGGLRVVKKCFWLNKNFLQSIIKKNS